MKKIVKFMCMSIVSLYTLNILWNIQSTLQDYLLIRDGEHEEDN
ncbi:Uncharacterised protein [Mammaliicoccus fleurettii]|nr:Uncharacterised protein [Mammaliicoccus fleurettii]